MSANKKIAKDFVVKGMVDVFRDMLAAYEKHWIDGVNQGEGMLLGDLRGELLVTIDHMKHLAGAEVESRQGIGKKSLHDLTRAGQQCSNPDCAKRHDLSSCEERNMALNLCSGCNINQYCSIGCQHQHWPAHKVNCKKTGGCKMKGQERGI